MTMTTDETFTKAASIFYSQAGLDRLERFSDWVRDRMFQESPCKPVRPAPKDSLNAFCQGVELPKGEAVLMCVGAGERVAWRIAEDAGCSEATGVRHLRIAEEAGFVMSRIEPKSGNLRSRRVWTITDAGRAEQGRIQKKIDETKESACVG